MKLYLHIGTEKTGSSFLQTYLAQNRSMLEHNGVYYPKAYFHNQDAMMLKGLISGGNAYELISLIDKGFWANIKEWLLSRYIQAKENNCDKLLLSSEVLIKKFSENGVLEKFLEIINSIGLICEDILLIIREPIGQALSLYKHHGKRGIMLPIEIWLEERYSLADTLIDFYKQKEHLGLKIKQYPYLKDSEYLVNICINKWLSLNEKIEVKHNIVNPSLTLSELILQSEIRKKDKILAAKFYNHMIQINNENKSDNQSYKRYITSHINNYLVSYNELWKTVGIHMNRKTKKYQYETIDIHQLDNLIAFSPSQNKAIASFLIYSSSFEYYQFRLISRIKELVLKIAPTFLIQKKKKNNLT